MTYCRTLLEKKYRVHNILAEVSLACNTKYKTYLDMGPNRPTHIYLDRWYLHLNEPGWRVGEHRQYFFVALAPPPSTPLGSSIGACWLTTSTVAVPAAHANCLLLFFQSWLTPAKGKSGWHINISSCYASLKGYDVFDWIRITP